MELLQRSRKNILVRALIQEGVVDFQCPQYAEYRWLARNARRTALREKSRVFGSVSAIVFSLPTRDSSSPENADRRTCSFAARRSWP